MPSVYLSVLVPVLQYLNCYNFCNMSWYLVGKLFLPVLKRVLSIIGSLPFHINYLSSSPKYLLGFWLRLHWIYISVWGEHLKNIICSSDAIILVGSGPVLAFQTVTFHILGYKQPTEKDAQHLDLWWEHSGRPLRLLKGRKSLARF